VVLVLFSVQESTVVAVKHPNLSSSSKLATF